VTHADPHLLTVSRYLTGLAPAQVGMPTGNVFCGTGPGGGVDPTCSPGGAAGSPRAAADAAPGLGDRQREEYADAAESVLAAMPAGARSRAGANVESWHFYPDRAALYGAVKEHLPDDVRAAVESGRAEVGGGYLGGRLHLAGAVPMETAAALGGTVNNVHHLLAHELSHALDGPGSKLSRTEDWSRAWAAEVVGVHDPEGAPERLSPRARSSVSEGFAEFGRLAYTRDAAGRADLAGRFPRCVAYWKEHGLWE
jgi:hypothetical protein